MGCGRLWSHSHAPQCSLTPITGRHLCGLMTFAVPEQLSPSRRPDMADPTAEQMALARRIAAKDAESRGADILAGNIRLGHRR